MVVLTVKTPDHSHIEKYEGARLLRVPVGSGDLRSRMEAFDRAVRRQLESEEYLLVHFFDPVSGYPLCERRGDFGYKLVYDACRFPSSDLPSLMPQEGSNKRLLARSRRQELFCLMNADAVIVGSITAKEHCVGLGVPPAHVSVLRSPVDLEPYQPSLMGTPDGSPMRLIHLGSHGRHQDLATVLEALSKVSAPTKLALVGPSSPELTPALQARIAELALADRVELQEPVSHADLHKVLAAADVGLVTLTDEPRNRTSSELARIGEILAAGRPLVAADLPLTRELCPEAATVFYQPGNAASLAEVLEGLASDPARRRALGAAARGAASAIDAKGIVAGLLEVYTRVAPAASAPSDAGTEGADPADATQLGGLPPHVGGDVTQASLRVPDADPGTNKIKTDPALQAHSPEADTGTDQAALRDRPPVMGVLLRDHPSARPEATDPAVLQQREPPVVMGLPVSDALPELEHLETPVPREAPPVDYAEEAEPRTRQELLPAPAPSAPPTAPTPQPASSAPELGALPAPTTDPSVTAPLPAPPPTAPIRPMLGAPDDEPLDFSGLLKPTAPPPPRVEPKPAPVPIVVPTSFGSPGPRPSVAPPGATFVPVPLAPPVTTVPARVSVPPPGPPPLPPSSTSGVRNGNEKAQPGTPVASSPSGVSVPAGVRPLESSQSGVRAAQPAPGPPLASNPSGVRAAPGSTTSAPGTVSSPSGLRQGPPPLPTATSPSGLRGAPPVALPPPLQTQEIPIVAGTLDRAATSVEGGALPPLSRLVPNPIAGGPPVLARHAEAPEEVHDDEVELVNDESYASLHDGDDEIDAGELHALETSAAPPPSALDPWFAQLVHGYCPPESQLFNRHVPPTTMPGRDT